MVFFVVSCLYYLLWDYISVKGSDPFHLFTFHVSGFSWSESCQRSSRLSSHSSPWVSLYCSGKILSNIQKKKKEEENLCVNLCTFKIKIVEPCYIRKELMHLRRSFIILKRTMWPLSEPVHQCFLCLERSNLWEWKWLFLVKVQMKFLVVTCISTRHLTRRNFIRKHVERYDM